MPGIINLHGHLGYAIGLEQDAKFYSRESVEDYSEDLRVLWRNHHAESGSGQRSHLSDIRDQQRAGRPSMARVYTAGLGLVYKGGFGGGISLPGVPTPILSDVKDVEPAVAEQARKKVDVHQILDGRQLRHRQENALRHLQGHYRQRA